MSKLNLSFLGFSRPTEQPERSVGSEGGSREPPWGRPAAAGSVATEDLAGEEGGVLLKVGPGCVFQQRLALLQDF